MSYDPNYKSRFNSYQGLLPLKKATILGNSWSGVNSYSNGYGLTQQQNLRANRNYLAYQFNQRSKSSVLTNNVTTLPAGNGAQFLGYGYVSTSSDSVNINV
jgi:hypothetical protein